MQRIDVSPHPPLVEFCLPDWLVGHLANQPRRWCDLNLQFAAPIETSSDSASRPLRTKEGTAYQKEPQAVMRQSASGRWPISDFTGVERFEPPEFERV